MLEGENLQFTSLNMGHMQRECWFSNFEWFLCHGLLLNHCCCTYVSITVKKRANILLMKLLVPTISFLLWPF